jgi:hypothetical protein
MRVKEGPADDSDAHRLSEQRIELDPGEFYEREWHDLSDFESVAALIETLDGSPQIEFEGPPGEWSKLERVRLYAGRLTENIKKIAVRIRATTATTVRVTVAFLKKEGREGLRRMSCKACKTFILFALNILLTSMGVPLISIHAPLAEHLNIAAIIKHLGAIVHSAGSILPEGLRAFFGGIAPSFWTALQGALDVVNFVTNHVDRGLEAGCRVVGCCR